MTTRAHRALAILAVVLTAACAPAEPTPSSPPEASAPAPSPIAVGSGGSVELQLMSEIYAQFLEASGTEVTRRPPFPDAAALVASLREGKVELAAIVVAELAPALGADAAEADIRSLQTLLAGDGLRLLEPSDAQRAIGVAMRQEDADGAGIQSISDLAMADGEIMWGLPNECVVQAECSLLLSTYGLSVDQLTVSPMPICAPESGVALNDGTVDASLVCTTQPEIQRFNLSVLEDDRKAFPVGTIAPLVRSGWLDAAPAELAAGIDAINAKIDTESLTSLTVEVLLEERAVTDVARKWLEDNGFI